MVPLCQIKLTSAHFGSKKKNVHEEKIIVADPENSKFKRDILTMKLNIKSKIKDTQIPFESHCYKVLSKSSVKSSSLFDHFIIASQKWLYVA